MLISEHTGWIGEYDIIIRHKDGTEERQRLKNRLTNAALNMMRDGLLGTATDFEIKYLALGTSGTPLNDNDTQLGNEQFRTPFVNQITPNTGVLQSTAIVLDNEAVFHVREIGVFATSAATEDPNTGVMISRVLWSRDKTNLESIQFLRTDTIGRG